MKNNLISLISILILMQLFSSCFIYDDKIESFYENNKSELNDIVNELKEKKYFSKIYIVEGPFTILSDSVIVMFTYNDYYKTIKFYDPKVKLNEISTLGEKYLQSVSYNYNIEDINTLNKILDFMVKKDIEIIYSAENVNYIVFHIGFNTGLAYKNVKFDSSIGKEKIIERNWYIVYFK